jgi:hypothetical protein
MLLGIITAAWGGNEINLKPGNTIELGGIVSSPVVVGMNVDFANSIKPSVISLKVAVQQGVPVTGSFPSGIGQELQITCDTGQNFIWANAFRQGTIKISDGDNSEATVEFGGGTPLEV